MWIDTFYWKFPSEIFALDFTSFYYIIFLFIVFMSSVLFNYRLRPFVMMLANIIFIYSYGIYNLYFVAVISIFTYLYSLIANIKKNKITKILSYLPLVLLLVYFKYFNINNYIVPLGLSFYTFKAISYLVDVVNDKVKIEKNPLYVFLYLSFFTTMIAGPINRSNEFFIELRNKRSFSYKEARNSGILLMLGIFEKIVISDYIGKIANLIFNNNELFGINVVLGIFLYSLQIYLDFDALSNIAIGSSKLLGFEFEKNFNNPYLSKGIKEFWRRWHISLSSWFRDYIYIELGGNKINIFIKYFNILLVFILSGLWHGNTFNFFIWGLLNGVLMILEDIIINIFKNIKFNKFLKSILNFILIIFNFIMVSILWLTFKFEKFVDIIALFERVIIKQDFNYELINITRNEYWWLIFLVLIVIILEILRYHFDMIKFIGNSFILFRWSFYIVLIIIFLIFGVYGGSFDAADFIYRWF